GQHMELLWSEIWQETKLKCSSGVFKVCDEASQERVCSGEIGSGGSGSAGPDRVGHHKYCHHAAHTDNR
ncbi:unnamed protein product, partial [Pleuronectes platessa]